MMTIYMMGEVAKLAGFEETAPPLPGGGGKMDPHEASRHHYSSSLLDFNGRIILIARVQKEIGAKLLNC